MKLGKNEELDVGDMTVELLERRPLPIGRKEFEEWTERIISNSAVQASAESLKFSLASMLMHLGPTEAFKPDAYFILSLRKAAVNQTAHAMLTELKEAQEARKKLAEATALTTGDVDAAVLEKKEL